MNGSATAKQVRKYPPVQEDVLEAFRRWISAERKCSYSVAHKPDMFNRTTSEVDYILTAAGGHLEIAAEISSVWRSGDAGEEDAHWQKWTEAVREEVCGRITGQYRLYVPVQIPRALSPTVFAGEFTNLVQKRGQEFAQLSGKGKGINSTLRGISVFVVQARLEGGDVSFGRHGVEDY